MYNLYFPFYIIQSPDNTTKSQSKQLSSENLESSKKMKSNENLSQENSQKGHQDVEQNEQLTEQQEMKQEQNIIRQQVDDESQQNQNTKGLSQIRSQKVIPLKKQFQNRHKLEEQEKKDEALRMKLLEWLRTEFMVKQADSFDLFIAFGNPNAEFLFNQINIDVGKDHQKIINKYYRLKDYKDYVNDVAELMYIAQNQILIKCSLFTGDSLKLLNKEWELGFERNQINFVHDQ